MYTPIYRHKNRPCACVGMYDICMCNKQAQTARPRPVAFKPRYGHSHVDRLKQNKVITERAWRNYWWKIECSTLIP